MAYLKFLVAGSMFVITNLFKITNGIRIAVKTRDPNKNSKVSLACY